MGRRAWVHSDCIPLQLYVDYVISISETLPPSHLMQGQPPAYTAPNTAAQSVPTQAAVHYDPNLQNV